MQNYIEQLEKFKINSTYRKIKNIDEKISKYIIVNGKKMLNLSSNDYLNLSCDKDLVSEFTDKYKNSNEFLFSSASARLLTGNSRCYGRLEKTISDMFKKENALLFNTGYQCNQGIVSALFEKSDCIFSDKLNHASIVSGMKLSPAQHFRYPHNDMNALEKLLSEKRKNYNNAIIISESVFSMDGDIAHLEKLVELKKKYNCLLMIDEAHAFCVFGDNLGGVLDEKHLTSEVDIITVTLGKALGSMGAVCISNNVIINYLINKASSFIFSTALPSVNVLWSNFLLNEKRNLLLKKKQKLQTLFKKVHEIYPTLSSSQIIPVILKDAQLCKAKAETLQNKGYYVLAINPPTVPLNTSRLRVSLCADIEFDEIREFFENVKNA
ncbi:pyridoxal phosphate-dependent aminotransferase family protein [bacterium]|nr:pyridoxal phosphate-dependent aminotransferase family protein [bacterium]